MLDTRQNNNLDNLDRYFNSLQDTKDNKKLTTLIETRKNSDRSYKDL
jgi:hypothetical protein